MDRRELWRLDSLLLGQFPVRGGQIVHELPLTTVLVCSRTDLKQNAVLTISRSYHYFVYGSYLCIGYVSSSEVFSHFLYVYHPPERTSPP